MNAQSADIHARGAYNGTSWSPEQREASAVNDYLGHMTAVKEEFSKWRTDDNAALLDADLEEYRQRYAAKYNAYLAAHSRIASQFITGAGGWTSSMVRSHEKKNDTCDKRCGELTEYSSRQLKRLRLRYNPRLIAQRPISSDDPAAIERLEDKIEQLERIQATMREANKIVRSKATHEEKIVELQELEGISELNADRLLVPDFCGRLGFADYALTNNGANIRRLKGRIEELKQREANKPPEGSAPVERETESGITYRENTDINRVQLLFPGKPADSVRYTLKQHGFRWSPTEGAWQRQLNPAGQWAAQHVLTQISN